MGCVITQSLIESKKRKKRKKKSRKNRNRVKNKRKMEKQGSVEAEICTNLLSDPTEDEDDVNDNEQCPQINLTDN